jgi:hypothetical protein
MSFEGGGAGVLSWGKEGSIHEAFLPHPSSALPLGDPTALGPRCLHSTARSVEEIAQLSGVCIQTISNASKKETPP